MSVLIILNINDSTLGWWFGGEIEPPEVCQILVFSNYFLGYQCGRWFSFPVAFVWRLEKGEFKLQTPFLVFGLAYASRELKYRPKHIFDDV